MTASVVTMTELLFWQFEDQMQIHKFGPKKRIELTWVEKSFQNQQTNQCKRDGTLVIISDCFSVIVLPGCMHKAAWKNLKLEHGQRNKQMERNSHVLLGCSEWEERFSSGGRPWESVRWTFS